MKQASLLQNLAATKRLTAGGVEASLTVQMIVWDYRRLGVVHSAYPYHMGAEGRSFALNF